MRYAVEKTEQQSMQRNSLQYAEKDEVDPSPFQQLSGKNAIIGEKVRGETMAFSIMLNPSSGVPFYKQIVNQVVFAVVNGLIRPGEQLPTVRQLAVDLEINLNTVSKAYRELEYKGIVTSQQGTGTFINEQLSEPGNEEKTRELEQMCAAFINEITSLGIPVDKALKMLERLVQEHKKSIKGRK